MAADIAEIACRLAEQAEAVCRHYLPAGRRERREWRVGDVRNAAGRSLFVRLVGPSSGRDRAGRWRDAATGESGDLLDLIRAAKRLSTISEALAEARRFLSLPERKTRGQFSSSSSTPDRYDPMTSVRRLIAESSAIAGTLAETYLRRRGILHSFDLEALRFHPRCPCRDFTTGRFDQRPALLSLVTNLDGVLTGIQRAYLTPDGSMKANVPAPRRSLGTIRRHGVRFGVIDDVGVIGEGVETVLSLKCAMPTMPMLAALSADNLVATDFHRTLRRLYVATDRDPTGRRAAKALSARLTAEGVRVVALLPSGEDFNADLMGHGAETLRSRLAAWLLRDDRRYLDEHGSETINVHRYTKAANGCPVLPP